MPYHANSIDAQQQSIASSLKDTYNRFEVINAKLKKFKTTSLKSSAALKVTKWLKERNDIDKCEQKLLNQAKSILKKIECGLNINRPFVEDDFDTFRRFSKTLSRRVKQTKHSTSKVESLRTELAVLEKALGDRQVQCTTELEQVRSKLKIHQYGNEGDSLPSEIVKALDDFRIEFDFILSERYVQGLGRALEVDIHTLSSSLQSNFRKIALSLSQHYNKEAHNVKVNSRNDNDNGWDERCQLILRSAFQQWSTHRNVKEKKACIRKIMEATGMPLIRCKEEWHELEILTISKNSEKVSRNAVKKAYDKTLRLGLEDISKMRHDTICNLAKITEVELNGELALEREYRLQLLRSLQRQIEDRQDEEARHMSKLEREEKLQLKNKRKSELSSQREKLRLHLESKHKEIYLSRLEDLRRENDEKEARLKRIKINKERVQYRQNRLENKNKMRLADAEKAYSDELMRQERLKALAASVPYRDALVNMKSNIHKSTLARTNDYYESSSDSGLSNFQIGLSKLNGFTNERLFSDPKFQLAHQLHERGVASSQYSQAVVKRLIPRETERTTGIQPY